MKFKKILLLTETHRKPSGDPSETHRRPIEDPSETNMPGRIFGGGRARIYRGGGV